MESTDHLQLGSHPSAVSTLTHLLEHRHAGAVLAVIADACFVLMDGLVQLLELDHGIAVEQILLMQMALTAVFTLLYLYRRSDPHLGQCLQPAGRLWWARGMVNSTSIACAFVGLRYADLSEAMTIYHLLPLPVALLCTLLLKEPYTVVQGIASVVVSFGGTLLIVKPTFLFGDAHKGTSHPLRWLGLLLAFTSMMLSAVDFFFLRKIGRAASPAILLLLYSTCGTLAGSILWLKSWEPFVGLSLASAGIFLLVIVFGVMAQVTLIAALQRETGTIVAILGYLQVAQAVGLQWVFQGTIPSATSLIGMIIIVAAGIWSIVQTDPPPNENKASEDEQRLLGP